MAKTDPTHLASRVSVRPLEYKNGSQILGHYRAVTFSGAVASISAAGILASLRWADASRYFVLQRLAANIEVLTAITTAPVFDLAAFVFRGSTGNATGSGSSTLTGGANNQKNLVNMSGTLLTASGGELRTIGTTTALTAAAGKTNDGAPFGAAFLPVISAVTATGTAVAVPVGAAYNSGWTNLYSIDSPYQHPIVLGVNEGIEVQVITANNTTGTVKYGFLWEWAEVESSDF